jgi:hypothetical protein
MNGWRESSASSQDDKKFMLSMHGKLLNPFVKKEKEVKRIKFIYFFGNTMRGDSRAG